MVNIPTRIRGRLIKFYYDKRRSLLKTFIQTYQQRKILFLSGCSHYAAHLIPHLIVRNKLCETAVHAVEIWICLGATFNFNGNL